MAVSLWLQALCLPRKWDVCGIKVPSLSCWHVFCLRNHGNGFLCGGGVSVDDAASVLLVASFNYARGRHMFISPNMVGRRARRNLRKLRRIPPKDIILTVHDYVSECTRTPKHFAPAGGGGPGVEGPGEWHLVQSLWLQHGIPWGHAWDTEYATARCAHDICAERNGDTSLRGEWSDAARERLLTRQAEQVGAN